MIKKEPTKSTKCFNDKIYILHNQFYEFNLGYYKGDVILVTVDNSYFVKL